MMHVMDSLEILSVYALSCETGKGQGLRWCYPLPSSSMTPSTESCDSSLRVDGGDSARGSGDWTNGDGDKGEACEEVGEARAV
ncbi:hypothetical protein PENSPDRAFT_369947 [Peniophora sp. CONT]|nr:hypothetical protein PENSPDRAFT_369947 [Peniophora sp. CONT]